MEDLIPRPASFPHPLAPNHTDRAIAPTDVWDWQAYVSWCDVIWGLLSEVANDEVRRAFLNFPPEYIVSDNLSWLDEIVFSVRGREIDSKEYLAERLSKRFKFFRAAHGTRVAELDAIYSKGLLPLLPDRTHARAQEIFLSGEFPELTWETLDAAIQYVGYETRNGRVFFAINEDELIEHCGHYMLYGSEYLVGIAAHLKGNRDYRQVLKRFGTPTVFICDVPLELIDHYTLLEFSGMALEMVFQDLVNGEHHTFNSLSGGGFCIHQRLPPECIVGHYHPVGLRDPLTGG